MQRHNETSEYGAGRILLRGLCFELRSFPWPSIGGASHAGIDR